MEWVDVLRVVNAVGATVVVLLLLTLPGGPSSRAMGFLAYALAMYSAAAAYGSIMLMGDPSIARPVMVFVAMTTSMTGVLMVRKERLGYAVLRPRAKRPVRRHAAPTTARVPTPAR